MRERRCADETEDKINYFIYGSSHSHNPIDDDRNADVCAGGDGRYPADVYDCYCCYIGFIDLLDISDDFYSAGKFAEGSAQYQRGQSGF